MQRAAILGVTLFFAFHSTAVAEDFVRTLQTKAIENQQAPWGHWGADSDNYVAWGTHSNRLIPVYTFGTLGAGDGIDLTSYQGAKSPYRNATALQRLYGRTPTHSVNPQAEYLDQTNIFDIQKAAVAAGKKHIFLIIFDGMDWQSTRNAAICKTGKVAYDSGRGTGLHMQDYTANGTTQFGFFCTAPHNEGTKIDVDKQSVLNPGGKLFGGYNVELGGPTPWSPGSDIKYLISQNQPADLRHAYTDSSCSASSMTAGIKSYNGAVNVDAEGVPVQTIAHLAQQQGYAVGAVTSVPISHATPACSYAHNVDRDDYQDLTRDLLGLKSISHPETPLPGLDVLIGTGFGDERTKDAGQGKNFVPGNAYLTADDLHAVDIAHGGKYLTSVRKAGVNGKTALQEAAEKARQGKHRLLGFYGVGKTKHLPFRTADGDFQPAPGRSKKAEIYTPADLEENPTLADMARAATTALGDRDRFWLMVEAGDVDWANHDNNLDNSIGAVISGDNAVKAVTDWVEQHSNWKDALVIVTADHGHYFHLTLPTVLTGQ